MMMDLKMEKAGIKRNDGDVDKSNRKMIDIDAVLYTEMTVFM
jgi:hypothetical protein